MSDDPVYMPCYDIRGELGPMIDEAIFEIAPHENVMWDISYAIVPIQGGHQVKGMIVLTMPNPLIGGPALIAGTIADHRRLLGDRPKLWGLVETLIINLRTDGSRQMREQMQQIRDQPPQP